MNREPPGVGRDPEGSKSWHAVAGGGRAMSYVKLLLLTAALIAGSSVATAQDWPTKPIRLIVPQGPASTVDIVARTFGDELRKSLGQHIVVQNKTGAGGTLASAQAAHAAPDGYTM